MMPASDNDELLSFADDADDAHSVKLELREPWQVLVIDDDPDVHQATRFVLKNLQILDSPLELTSAYSAAEAKEVLARGKEFAVILLDVVMESNDAGLQLVHYIRQEMCHVDSRIILRTGQPGYAPELSVIRDYDINDYKTKSDLTHTRLITSLTASIRSYQQLKTINASRKGLDLIVQNAPKLFSRQSMDGFAEGVLIQVSALLGLAPEGLICLSPSEAESRDPNDWYIISAGGKLRNLINLPLAELPDSEIRKEISEAVTTRNNRFTDQFTVLFINGSNYQDAVIFLGSGRRLSDVDQQLLELFSTNIAVGFQNVQLLLRLNQMAYHDALCDMPNRQMFIALLDQIIRERPDDWVVAMLDVRRFSEVNDALGHQLGDFLLQKVALRLRSLLKASVIVARVGVDQYALTGKRSEINFDEIRAELNQPYWVNSNLLRIQVAMALMEIRDASGDGLDCLKNITLTLNQAKRQDDDQPVVYTPQLTENSRRRVELLHQLYQALENNQLELWYQPQLDLRTGKPLGVEALLRWPQNDGKFISPVEFIPLAESSGLIIELGEWVTREALAQKKAWMDAQLPPLRMAINVSMMQFNHNRFITRLEELLTQYAVPAESIELEITESVAMQNPEMLIAELNKLKAMGFSIAIDDFGTGFSSLSYLKQLPVDRLKIDRSFVNQLQAGEEQNSIANMVIQLGHTLKFDVIAEGVETQEQAQQLASLGCDEVQGFLYGKPMRNADLLKWLGQFS